MTPPDSNDDHLAELRRRWEEDPGSRIFLQLAEEYRRAGRNEEALEVLEKGMEAHPKQVSGLVSLGRIHLALDQPGEAAEALEKAVEIDPTNPMAMKLATEAHLQAGDRVMAKQRLDLYKLLNAGDEDTEALEARVEGRGTDEAEGEPPVEPAEAADAVTGGYASEFTDQGTDQADAEDPADDRPEPFGDLLSDGGERAYLAGLASEGIFPAEEVTEEPAEEPTGEPEEQDEAAASEGAPAPAGEDTGKAEPFPDLGGEADVDSGDSPWDLVDAEATGEAPSGGTDEAAEEDALVVRDEALPATGPEEELPAPTPDDVLPAATPDEELPAPIQDEALPSPTPEEVPPAPAPDAAIPDTAADSAPPVPATSADTAGDGPRPTVTLGQLYLDQGHPVEALAIFEAVLEREPDREAAAEGRRAALAAQRAAGAIEAAQEADQAEEADTAPPAGFTLQAAELLRGADPSKPRKVALLEAYLDRIR